MKKDILAVFIFGHFKNVHFQKLTPNVFQTFIKRASLKELFYMGFFKKYESLQMPLYMSFFEKYESLQMPLYMGLTSLSITMQQKCCRKDPEKCHFWTFLKIQDKITFMQERGTFLRPSKKGIPFFSKIDFMQAK